VTFAPNADAPRHEGQEVEKDVGQAKDIESRRNGRRNKRQDSSEAQAVDNRYFPPNSEEFDACG
jgi:hypothetical protein